MAFALVALNDIQLIYEPLHGVMSVEARCGHPSPQFTGQYQSHEDRKQLTSKRLSIFNLGCAKIQPFLDVAEGLLYHVLGAVDRQGLVSGKLGVVAQHGEVTEPGPLRLNHVVFSHVFAAAHTLEIMLIEHLMFILTVAMLQFRAQPVQELG